MVKDRIQLMDRATEMMINYHGLSPREDRLCLLIGELLDEMRFMQGSAQLIEENTREWMERQARILGDKSR
jgi:hypothetical protein